MNRISLLGCGKLGLPLGLQLIDRGYYVKGSTTTASKIDKFKQSGIIPYLLNIDKLVESDFFKSDILVLTLPYKKSFSDPNIYKNQIKRVCDSIKFSSIKHVVFTSSSSVYPKDAKLYLPTDKFIPPYIRAEIARSLEFSNFAINKETSEKLKNLMKNWKIDLNEKEFSIDVV